MISAGIVSKQNLNIYILKYPLERILSTGLYLDDSLGGRKNVNTESIEPRLRSMKGGGHHEDKGGGN